MEEIVGINEMKRLIESEDFILFYLSRPECGLCGSLITKITDISKKYTSLKVRYVDLNKDESISGQYSIYTIPGILVFVNGKETIREARFISIPDIDSKLRRVSEMMG